MVFDRQSAPIVVVVADVVTDQQLENDNSSCDNANDGVCRSEHQPVQESKPCFSSSHNQKQLSSIAIGDFYHEGMSAQAYKPNAPVKSSVCEVTQINSGNGDDSNQPQHTVAHRAYWRSKYDDVVPLIVHGNIYSCGSPSSPQPTSPSSDALLLEVWQARPDGTFSSLRPGIEVGECRASVPVDTKTTNTGFSNIIGQVQFETLAPGSPGILGGLMPDSSRDYPPYGPGVIHMYLNVEGYYPVLGQLNIHELEDWMLQKDSEGRFRFKGFDIRPHAARKSTKSVVHHGIEIQSVQKVSRPGYNSALEVNVDLYLVPNSGANEVGNNASAKKKSLSDVFCSSQRHFSWISSFFKEPIAICFPSLLDFFPL